MSNSGGIVLAGAGRVWRRATHAPGHMGERARAGIDAAHAQPPWLPPQTFAHAADRPLLCCTTPAATTPITARTHAAHHMHPHSHPATTALHCVCAALWRSLRSRRIYALQGSGRVALSAEHLHSPARYCICAGSRGCLGGNICPLSIAPANTARADQIHIACIGQRLSAIRCPQAVAAPRSALAVYPTCDTQVCGTCRTLVSVSAASGTDCTRCRTKIVTWS